MSFKTKYKFLTANRKDRPGGGIGVYIAEHIQFKLRSDLSVFQVGISESLFIELINRNKDAIVEVFYIAH